MEISYNTHAGGMDVTQGYGYAGYHIIQSLQKLGYSTPFNRAESPVLLNFTQPFYYQYHGSQYNIGYTPWESTKLHDGWQQAMNACSEIWTTSDWCAKVFKDEGVEKPIFVFEHGIDHDWTPAKRIYKKQMRFLHFGEPAVRKGGQLAFDAFTELFGDDPNYQLTIKANGPSSIRARTISGEISSPTERFKNVKIVKKMLDLPELISLIKDHHAMIYPSFGEGFGFIPLQGLASGMPVVFNTTWAQYRKFSMGLDVSDHLIDSPWPDIHPGQVLQPSKESIKENMMKLVDDYDKYATEAYSNAPLIHREYDWMKVTSKAFNALEKRL